jgi:hypothetical protein
LSLANKDKDREEAMQSHIWISGIGLALGVSVQSVAAGPKEDVAAGCLEFEPAETGLRG